jgi:hypothetical protein
MVNILLKKILEVPDIAAVQPNFTLLAKLPREAAVKAETLIFDSDKSVLWLLTTNNHPDSLAQIIVKLTEKGHKVDVYYTDSA